MTLMVALFAIPMANAAITSVTFKTGTTEAIVALPGGQPMTAQSDGTYVLTTTVNPDQPYFCFFVSEGFSSTAYGPGTTSILEINLAAEADVTQNLVANPNAERTNLWHYTGSVAVEYSFTVNPSNGTVQIKNLTPASALPTKPAPASIYFTQGRFSGTVSYLLPTYGNMYEMKSEGNNGIYKLNIKLDPSTPYFCFWQFKSPNFGTPIGPSEEADVVSVNVSEGKSFSSSIFPLDDPEKDHCWELTGYSEPVKVNLTLNWLTQKLTVEYDPTPDIDYGPELHATFDFEAENFILGKFINNYMRVTDLMSLEEVSIAENPYDFAWHLTTGLNFAATDGYEFNIECTNYTGDPDKAPYQIDSNSQMADEVIEYGKQSVLTLMPGADGLNFKVTINRIPQENLPNELYMMIGATGLTLNQQLAPGPDDPVLMLNPETNCYEGQVELEKKRFKFYTPTEEGGYKVFGQNGTAADGTFGFNRDFNPFVSECAWEADNCWYFAYTYNNYSKMEVKIVLDPINNIATFYPVMPEAPANLYLWGSRDGGHEFSLIKAVPNQGDGIFQTTYNAPYVGKGSYTDEAGFVTDFEGWYFMLCANNNQYNSGMFRAEEGQGTIDFNKTNSFSTALTGSTPLNMITAGEMVITYNWNTFELTVTNPQPKTEFEVTFTFEGEGVTLTNLDECLEVYDMFAGTPIEINANPYTFTYLETGAGVVFAGLNNWKVGIECTNYEGAPEDAPFSISGIGVMVEDGLIDFGTQYTLNLLSGANGLNFLISLENEDKSGVDTVEPADGRIVVFNLQGVKVLESDNATDINLLPRGLYIVNGRKVIL